MEDKEITTLHPYLNRNKNRYPNVRDENIPESIQRKLIPGDGISIDGNNVISATTKEVDAYTKDESDAKYATKTEYDDLNKATPTDIGIKDNKLGLLHDSLWLTNQGAINLENFEYDEATNTLKPKGGGESITVCKGSVDIDTLGVTIDLETFKHTLLYGGLLYITDADDYTIACNTISATSLYETSTQCYIYLGDYKISPTQHDLGDFTYRLNITDMNNIKLEYIPISNSDGTKTIRVAKLPNENTPIINVDLSSLTAEDTGVILTDGTNHIYLHRFDDYLYGSSNLVVINNSLTLVSYGTFYDGGSNPTWGVQYSQLIILNLIIPKQATLFGNHTILVPSNSSDNNIDLYNHNIVITSADKKSVIYMTITSSSNLIVDSITDLNTLLKTQSRNIMVTGIRTLDGASLPIISIDWNGAFVGSNYTWVDPINEEDNESLTTAFGSGTITDVVTTI